MEVSFKINDFEGPLDLLLHLIEKNKADILDLPIAVITDQYMEYISGVGEGRLDNMSEFLVMASTLLEIKAKMLLPPEVDEQGEEIDPREELVASLLEYKMYKYMSYDLREMEKDAEKTLFGKEQFPAEVKSYRPPVDVDALLSPVTLEKLSAIFRDVMKRQEDRFDPVHGSFGQIPKETVNTRKVMNSVANRIRRKRRCTFRSLLSEKKGKMYVVVTFLTVLELIKRGLIGVEQDDIFSEIMITAKGDRDWDQENLELDQEG